MGYWENRQAELMVGYMQTAEDAAAEIARAYEAAAAYMQQEIDKVFQRFVSEYGLTEEAAKRILGNVTDLRSLNSLRAAVIASGENADELLAEMNSGAYAARMRRWEDVQDSLDEVIGRLRGTEQRESTACYRGIAERAYTGTIEGVEQMVGFDFTYTAVDPSAIDLVLRTPFVGQNYSQRIWNNTQAVAESVREQMLLGVMTGKSQSQMAQEITERFGVGASNARRLVRTESAFVANEMQAQAYEECGADEYEYVATLDMRTSEVCQALDGQVFAVRDRQVGVNYPPMHPYCRSTTVIHLDEETVEGLERRRIARDQTTGQNTYVPADMTYRQWAQSQGLTTAQGEITPNPDNDVTRYCEASGIQRRPVRAYGTDPVTGESLTPDTEAVIERLGGKDPTRGSCQSLALAYAGNRAGYDVEDFRGGTSQSTFSRKSTLESIAGFPGVTSYRAVAPSDFRSAAEVLEHVEAGREYILATGGHAAVVRRAESGLQYLELQAETGNGFYALDRSVLARRFNCRKSHSSYGTNVQLPSVLIDIESLFGSPEFLDVLEFINTAVY